MPRNRSELAPQYSPAVTAWLIAWHRHMFLCELSMGQESIVFSAMAFDEQEYWDKFDGVERNTIAKQVYDAAQPK